MSGRAFHSSFSFVETSRGPLWTGRAGSGPDVISIAGLGDTHEAWDCITPLLTDDFRVTVFDNRGVGRSSLQGHPTVNGFAQDALALMRSLDIPHAHVVGSSMGGAIAQEVALSDPSRVASLVLVGTWAGPDAHLGRLLRHMARLPTQIADERELMEAMCLWLYSGRAYADGTVDDLIALMERSDSPPQSPETFALSAEAAIMHDATKRLGTLRTPTLIVVGDEDRICPPRLSRDLLDLILDSRLHVMSERGHLPFQEDPVGFVHALRVFWNDN